MAYLPVKKAWRKKDIATLKKLYPNHTVREIAAEINLSFSAISHKAIELGLKKGKHHRVAQNEESVKALYLTHSNFQIAQLTGLSQSHVERIISKLGLKRTKEESTRIRSEARKRIIREEKQNTLWGFDSYRKIKVVTSRKKITFRHRMRKRGYTGERNANVMYYSSKTERNRDLERVGRIYGIMFVRTPMKQCLTYKY